METKTKREAWYGMIFLLSIDQMYFLRYFQLSFLIGFVDEGNLLMRCRWVRVFWSGEDGSRPLHFVCPTKMKVNLFFEKKSNMLGRALGGDTRYCGKELRMKE